ncbi:MULTISPECIES: YobH family protein [Tatumella]|uniref:Uncharacterized protein YobH n=1 Tax=Tatumella punctata TaxID=399969 RepID=A0ABW1VHM2_9GAMM|nr:MULTISPECIES: YobH family protein [unclassified Tatumella]MBS0855381.1 hypothetical protein [Tatumella sp. JGM16]MBS0877249.1 hypothetical protein [Tatumella sp. JGM82]MBS0889382.1 hypothetical protein [Tatumella sp. JGM94]MBS0894070.1 hypothetical protein [Tatumella sp. JGM130]MBS0901646.1 hypothetical protein [Tatumella sp. JGM100]
MIVRSVLVLTIIWLGMLLSGYGVLTGSQKIAAGLGLRCQYLTAKGLTVSHYLQSDSGVIGKSSCPWIEPGETPADYQSNPLARD